MSDLIDRQAAIDAFDGHFAIVGRSSAERFKMYIEAVKNDIRKLPPAHPHTYRGVTLNDVMMYFDSLSGNEDAWTEFCSCFECRGWKLVRIQDGDARQDFMDIVYSELESDPDNNRANRIIDAADEYAESANATDKNVGTKISRESLDLARAIDGLTEWQKHVQTDSNINRDITVAIEALKAQLGTNLAEVGTDCISRQAAIDALDEQIAQCNKALKSFELSMKDEYAAKVEKASLTAFRERLEYLPPAQPEPCEDAVSRKDCLQALSHLMDVEGFRSGWAVSRANVECMLKAMPSVMPKQRTGKWERHYSRPNVYADLFWHCSECGYKNNDDYAPTYHKFCPNCGIKMIQTDKTCDCYSDGRCVGTKEIDLCSCGGNKSKCDFYENVRREGDAE